MILPLWFKILLGVFLFFLGASVYSFLNVVIFRVPRGEEFVKTRSHCPGCGKLLSPWELVPVVSYLCLGGKCKKCGSKIGLRDVSIEIFGGLSSIASVWIPFLRPEDSVAKMAMETGNGWMGAFYGCILAGLTMFAFIGALTVVTFIQIDMDVVKTGTLIALAVPVAASFFTLPEWELMDRVIAGAVLGILMVILHLVFKKTVPMGLAVMMALSGIMIGFGKTVMVLLPVTVVVALLEWVILLILGKKPMIKHFKLAFALGVGSVVAVLFGTLCLDFLEINGVPILASF